MDQPGKKGRKGHFPTTFGKVRIRSTAYSVWSHLGTQSLSLFSSSDRSAPFNLHKQGPPFQDSAVSKTRLHTSDILPKHQQPWEVWSDHVENQFLLLWVFAFVKLLPTRSRQSAGCWTGPLPTSSLPSAARGKLVAAISLTLWYFNQGVHRSPQDQELWICSRDCNSLKIQDQLCVCALRQLISFWQ